jgi:hypothetical protein
LKARGLLFATLTACHREQGARKSNHGARMLTAVLPVIGSSHRDNVTGLCSNVTSIVARGLIRQLIVACELQNGLFCFNFDS